MALRVLVCGGRFYDDYKKVVGTLNNIWRECSQMVLIHGCAKGADTLADEWSKNAWLFDVAVERYPANWNKFGKSAGYIRNKQMLDDGKPELVVAFPGGVGTRMMIDLAKKANVEVLQIE